MELNFYHVTEGNLVPAVIRLLEKIYISGKHCIFYSPLEERVKLIDKTLWTFSTNAFIPHGDKTLGFAESQPIYFTSEIKNPNSASTVVFVDTFDYLSWSHDFEKILFVFEEKTQAEIAFKIYMDLKNKKENVNYWQQSQKGWERLN